MKPFFKKHFFTALWVLVLGILLFYTPAKILLLRAFIYTGLFNASTKKETPFIKDSAVVNLSFTNQNGARLNTTDIRGKVIFINFWATWCPPCVAEMSSINALYNKLKTNPRIVFILADADNNMDKSFSFMKTNNYSLPVYAISSTVPDNIFSGTLPETIIIDTSGNIIQKHEGFANYDTNAMITFLQSLL